MAEIDDWWKPDESELTEHPQVSNSETNHLPRWGAASAWRLPPVVTWMTLVALLLFSIPAFLVGDVPGLLMLFGIAATATGTYAAIRRRLSWALLGRQWLRTVVAVIGVISLAAGVALESAQNAEGLPPSTTEATLPASPSATSPPIPEPTFKPTGEPTAEASPPVEVTALDLLATLQVKGRAPKTGYDRELQFGAAWTDVDQNGCDTRNDILARDLDDITVNSSCQVTSGTFHDPYTGTTINFVRGYDTSVLVQIDHVVALSNAWQTGAQQLSLERRIQFANDPLNLLASDGAANQQKGAGDAATWLPSNKSFRCEYVARQISVKAKYALWVTPPELEASTRILGNCPTEPALR